MIDVPDDEYEERVERARLARQEARETIREQRRKLSAIDEKALHLFRTNILLASIVVSGVSLALGFDGGDPAMLLTPYTSAAAALLFTSTIIAAVTHTSTSEKIGISEADISDSILDTEFDYDLVEDELAREYGSWIRYNYERNASNALLLTLALVSVVASICYMVIGMVDIYSDGSIGVQVNVAVVVFFLGVGKLSGIYGQTVRWWRVTSPSDRFRDWWSNSIANPGIGETTREDGDGAPESDAEAAIENGVGAGDAGDDGDSERDGDGDGEASGDGVTADSDENRGGQAS